MTATEMEPAPLVDDEEVEVLLGMASDHVVLEVPLEKVYAWLATEGPAGDRAAELLAERLESERRRADREAARSERALRPLDAPGAFWRDGRLYVPARVPAARRRAPQRRATRVVSTVRRQSATARRSNRTRGPNDQEGDKPPRHALAGADRLERLQDPARRGPV